MNSFNDNLRQTMIDILSTQESELAIQSSSNQAAQLALYYAQGSQLNAESKRDLAQVSYGSKERLFNEADSLKELVSNILTSANQGKALVENAMSLSATTAANVQIASNAIMKLASDIGSVFSMVNAADFNSEIYEMANECNALISKTAYLAESASQISMELTLLAAEVDIPTLNSTAEKTNVSIKDLVSVLNDQLATVKEHLNSTCEALKNTNAGESQANETFKLTSANRKALENSLILANEKLNLNLEVKNQSFKSFTVSFDYLKEPFEGGKGIAKNYYILLVKNSERLIFTIADAEQAILNQKVIGEVVPSETDPQQSASITINAKDLIDSDGDPIQLGQAYAIFVLAAYTSDYKKAINNYNDYLSAPSQPFSLSHTLQHAESESIKLNKTTNTLSFGLIENTDFKVEYRCMYLLIDSNGKDGSLTFPFSTSIAEQVNAGCYDVAHIVKKKINEEESSIVGTTQITGATTDNFGNPLIEGKTYLPVVLSFCTEKLTVVNQFTNSLSALRLTAPFIFQTTK
ncbi:hypothetical protein [uncultured Roseivirga sp.]|uniref:hypothetical protein n=1 Tax=uncultured Roseivirga sp. TaxID=543088 RepID=UPI0030D8517C|tara:strand:+ start:115152 stop:116720 length:1569 start_codon:yes stop_codon:yes gene_type:complete